MRYKILKRIQDGQSTVGFQLLSEEGKIINVSKDQVLRAASNGLVINAVYNKHTKSISGVTGTDLRKLPVMQYSEIVTSKNTGAIKTSKPVKRMSNHEMAKEYLNKFKVAKMPADIVISFLDNDRVSLDRVVNTNSDGKFVMPSFITEHSIQAFKNCIFSEIVIGHDYPDWHGLFWGMNSERLTIKYSGKHLKNLKEAFKECRSLVSLDVSSLDTSDVTDMSFMFYECDSLKSLDVSRFSTGSVSTMKGMFRFCKWLRQLDVSRFNTRNVTDMSCMFSGCASLRALDLNNFNTGNVTDMSYMFEGCQSIVSLDLRKFNTTKVEDMISMFNGCYKLAALDVSSFDTSNVKNMVYMFSGCSSLKSLTVSNFDTRDVKDMAYMFSGCSSLTELDLSYFNTRLIGSRGSGSMMHMFSGCKSLKSLNVSSFNTRNVQNMYSMFLECESLETLDLSNFVTDNVREMSSIFNGCKALKYLDISRFNIYNCVYEHRQSMFKGCNSLIEVVADSKRVYVSDIREESPNVRIVSPY